MSLTLTCGQVAEALGYLTRDGRPNRPLIRKLVTENGGPRIPPPIDDTLATVHWRWSRAEIEAYATGNWKASA
jgi:hypothetical protein